MISARRWREMTIGTKKEKTWETIYVYSEPGDHKHEFFGASILEVRATKDVVRWLQQTRVDPEVFYDVVKETGPIWVLRGDLKSMTEPMLFSGKVSEIRTLRHVVEVAAVADVIRRVRWVDGVLRMFPQSEALWLTEDAAPRGVPKWLLSGKSPDQSEAVEYLGKAVAKHGISLLWGDFPDGRCPPVGKPEEREEIVKRYAKAAYRLEKRAQARERAREGATVPCGAP